jgi:hypothetical protein
MAEYGESNQEQGKVSGMKEIKERRLTRREFAKVG